MVGSPQDIGSRLGGCLYQLVGKKRSRPLLELSTAVFSDGHFRGGGHIINHGLRHLILARVLFVFEYATPGREQSVFR